MIPDIVNTRRAGICLLHQVFTIDSGQSTECFLIASIGPCDPQLLKKSAGSFTAYCQTVSTGGVAEGGGEPAFTSPGRPGDVKVMPHPDPFAVDQRDHLRAIKAAFDLIIDILDAVLMPGDARW